MCGLFGVYYYGDIKDLKGLSLPSLVKKLGRASVIRGVDATGIAYVIDNRKIEIDKKGVSAYQFKFDIPDGVGVVMGHVRAATHGDSKKNYNNHPFRGKTKNTDFALAHNGIIDNYFELRIRENLTNNKIETDSYVAVQLLEKYGVLNMANVKKMAETIRGSFTITILDEDENLYIVKNDNPIVIAHFPKYQLYAYASTDNILIEALMNHVQTKGVLIDTLTGKTRGEVELLYPDKGQIWVLTKDGAIIRDTFKPQERFFYSGYYRGYGWDYDYCFDYSISKKSNKKFAEKDDAYTFLMQLADQHGYTADEINFLLELGYTEAELYDLIVTDNLDTVLFEEYAYYYEGEGGGNKELK